MIEQPFHILILFSGIIALALLLSERFEIAKKVSPIILILAMSAFLSNVGVLSTENPFYKGLSDFTVPFAVILILFHVRLSDLKNAGLPMLIAFGFSSLGSMLGCMLGGVVLRGSFDEILGGQGWKIVGPYIGTYIGGSINFFALWNALEINEANLFAAANAVDNLTIVPIFMFWIVAPTFLGKYFRDDPIASPEEEEKGAASAPTSLRVVDIATLCFCALLIMFLSDWLKASLFRSWLPSLPTILITTTLALIAAQSSYIQRLQGSREIGNLSFYLFFAAVGAMMDIPRAISLAPVLFLFVLVVIAFQICFVLAAARVFRIDLKVAAVSAIAAKLGPSSVVALTNAKKWNSLALPGVAAGLLGYAVGNYAGFAGAYLLRLFW
jgi:uncharacterized membrane protein